MGRGAEAWRAISHQEQPRFLSNVRCIILGSFFKKKIILNALLKQTAVVSSRNSLPKENFIINAAKGLMRLAPHLKLRARGPQVLSREKQSGGGASDPGSWGPFPSISMSDSTPIQHPRQGQL